MSMGHLPSLTASEGGVSTVGSSSWVGGKQQAEEKSKFKSSDSDQVDVLNNNSTVSLERS